MYKISKEKYRYLEKLSDQNGIISALAIDQRGSLKKMLGNSAEEKSDQKIVEFKELISEELTPFASSILLDPEFGLSASSLRNEHSGLLLAYEKTGYDVKKTNRLPDILDDFSVARMKELGADAVKFLLYYDIDSKDETNAYKKQFIEKIGTDCMKEKIPFFLEIVTYDERISSEKSKEFALVKPKKVIGAMREFSESNYFVDVLKVEIPVNMDYVKGFSESDSLYSEKQAMDFFKEQSNATELPFIFLSAGVSAELFLKTLEFAKKAGSDFNGVLCGRATWKEGAEIYAKYGKLKTIEWLQTTGVEKIQSINAQANRMASSWKEKVDIS